MDAPLDAPFGVHGWRCPHCSASRTGFNSKRSAASSKDRHIREKHKRGGVALAARRQHRDARAHRDQRTHVRVRGTVLVTRPTPTRAQLCLSETARAGTALPSGYTRPASGCCPLAAMKPRTTIRGEERDGSPLDGKKTRTSTVHRPHLDLIGLPARDQLAQSSSAASPSSLRPTLPPDRWTFCVRSAASFPLSTISSAEMRPLW